jgi:MoaA/NifB/PqqE/SkfB family radical SAM enzyme
MPALGNERAPATDAAYPLIVVCRVNTACNLGCGFCAYDRRLPFARSTVATAHAERLIALMVNWYARQSDSPCGQARPPLLSWLGGEPLLWRDWVRCSALARACGLAVSATTNATTLASAAVRTTLLDNLDELTVSVDAVGDRHDALRGWRGGYARTLAAVRELADARSAAGRPLRLRANIVLMRSTVDDFARLVGELAAAGIDEISFNLLGGRDRPEFHAGESVPPSALDRLLRQMPLLRTQLAQAGTTLIGNDDYATRLRAASRRQRWPVADCAPGTRFLFVDERGRVAPCAFTADEYGVALDDIASLDELPMRFVAARRARCASACGDCPSTQVFGKFGQPDNDVDLLPEDVAADAGEWA